MSTGIATSVARIKTIRDDIRTKLVALGIATSSTKFSGLVTAINGITLRTASSVTASGATVSVPKGYYNSAVSKSVGSGSATTPATTITSAPTITVSSDGLITASNSKTQSVTPTVSAGYVSSGTAGTITVSGSNTKQLTTKAAATITPGTSNIEIAAGTYLKGKQTIAGDADLVAANIVYGKNIFNVAGSATGLILSSVGSVLHITTRAGSTVTVSKGSISATLTGVVNSSDTSFAEYYYAVPAGQTGTWTCKATYGSYTDQKTVSVSSSRIYDVTLGRTYLISNGVRQSTLTHIDHSGGVTDYSGSYVEFNSAAYSGWHLSYWLVDLTPYSTLYYYLPIAPSGTSAIRIYANGTSNWNTTPERTGSTVGSVATLDISGLGGIHQVGAFSSDFGNIYVKDLYLCR